jgi:hypothetical protein
MARGNSGRIVIDVTPEFKDELYSLLSNSKCTLKSWFITEAQRFMEEQRQPVLFKMKESAVTGRTNGNQEGSAL